MSKDLFSGHADLYASFRPTYPNDLFQFIFKNVGQFDKAWDCGTGNGQVAQSLAPHFKSVEATDISRKQLENAKVIENINYQVCSAESTPFSKNSFDLISVGQAIHWFDLNKFYSECQRVAKPGCVIALFGYSPMRMSMEFAFGMDEVGSAVTLDHRMFCRADQVARETDHQGDGLPSVLQKHTRHLALLNLMDTAGDDLSRTRPG